MAGDKKRAQKMNAYLAFLDETGMMMAPLVRKTWAPRAQTPVLYQRTRSHRKVSVIGALCVAPTRERCHFYFRTHPDRNINAESVLGFLKELLRELDAPVFLIWDRLSAHRARDVQDFVADSALLHTFLLPPYAPELNPTENAWSYWKMNPMANYAPTEFEELVNATRSHGRSIQRRMKLLFSFVEHSGLPLDLKAA